MGRREAACQNDASVGKATPQGAQRRATRHRWHLSDPANESSSASRLWASPFKSCNGRLAGEGWTSRLHDPSLLCAAASSRGVRICIRSRSNRSALCRSRKRPLRGGHCKTLPRFCKGGGSALRTGRCAPLGVSRSVASRPVMHQEPRTALGRDWVGRDASDALWGLPTPLGASERRERKTGTCKGEAFARS